MHSQEKQLIAALRWNIMSEHAELAAALEHSAFQPVAFFKHSIRCGVSSHAMHRLAEDWDFAPDQLPLYYLDLINHRSLSNRVTEILGVAHQSPQLILVYDHQPVFHASHLAISGEAVRKALSRLELEER